MSRFEDYLGKSKNKAFTSKGGPTKATVARVIKRLKKKGNTISQSTKNGVLFINKKRCMDISGKVDETELEKNIKGCIK